MASVSTVWGAWEYVCFIAPQMMRQEDHVKSVASLSAPLLEVLRKR